MIISINKIEMMIKSINKMLIISINEIDDYKY
jgi:hypothetical protein